jgi:hypothetical protein
MTDIWNMHSKPVEVTTSNTLGQAEKHPNFTLNQGLNSTPSAYTNSATFTEE